MVVDSSFLIISFKYAATRRGPSGKKSFMFIPKADSGNASKGTARWKPVLPEYFSPMFLMLWKFSASIRRVAQILLYPRNLESMSRMRSHPFLNSSNCDLLRPTFSWRGSNQRSSERWKEVAPFRARVARSFSYWRMSGRFPNFPEKHAIISLSLEFSMIAVCTSFLR